MTVFLRGIITPDYAPLVRDFYLVRESGELPVEAILDTGFSGQVILPRRIRPMGHFELVGATSYELASGEVVSVEMFKTVVRLGKRTLPVEISCTDSNVGLIGMELIDGKRASFNLKTRTFRVFD